MCPFTSTEELNADVKCFVECDIFHRTLYIAEEHKWQIKVESRSKIEDEKVLCMINVPTLPHPQIISEVPLVNCTFQPPTYS